MEQYKSNSHKSKTEARNNEKRVEKVVKGKVKTKHKKGISKISDMFISEDMANVKSYIFMDVLVPAMKKAISDIVTDGIDRILYGETGRSGKRRTNSSYVSYSSYSRKDDRRNDRGVRTRNGYSLDDIILETRGEAEEVLSRMDELIDAYGEASVADLYDLIGVNCNYTDNKYGWTNIRNAEVIRVRDGYMLKMPRVLPLD